MINNKIFFMSLGCDKNLVDSEHMLGLLKQAGFDFTDNEYEADVIVINTCCFIGDAKQESIDSIIEMGLRKQDAKCKALIIAGCLAERYTEQIHELLPEVDAIIGTMAIEEIVRAVKECLEEKDLVKDYKKDINSICGVDVPRVTSTLGYYSYLKIAEGCDKHCTYCIIPKVRGNYRSFPMESLVTEAKELAEAGVKELILVAQETTMYGIDIYGKKSLHLLLKELCKIQGLVWIRVLYCYPEEIYDELIDVIASEKKICKYLDIPIQHASDRILHRMGRKTSNADLRNIIDKLRSRIPGLVLRTTLIAGFPDETQEDQDILLNFVDEIEFERLGVFTYSAEEDTPAATYPNQIDQDVKEQRRDQIMELQQEIIEDNMEKYIGREFTALVEGKIPDEHAYIARTYMDIPGVDSNIFIVTDQELMTGDFVKVQVTGAQDYDLIGELV